MTETAILLVRKWHLVLKLFAPHAVQADVLPTAVPAAVMGALSVTIADQQVALSGLAVATVVSATAVDLALADDAVAV